MSVDEFHRCVNEALESKLIAAATANLVATPWYNNWFITKVVCAVMVTSLFLKWLF